MTDCNICSDTNLIGKHGTNIYNTVGHDHSASANPHTCPYHYTCGNTGGRINPRTGIDNRSRMNSRSCSRSNVEALTDNSERKVWIVNHQHRHWRLVRMLVAADNCCCPGFFQLRPIAGIGEKADLPGTGALQRAKP